MSSSCQIEAGEPWGVSPRSSGCSTSHRVPAGKLWPTLQASIARSTNTLALSVLIFSAPFNSGKPLGCWRDRKGFGPLTLAHFALENSPQGGVAKRASHSPISEREGVAIYCVLAGICNQFVTSLVFSGVKGKQFVTSSPIRCNKLITGYQATGHQLHATRPTLLVTWQQKQTHLESRQRRLLCVRPTHKSDRPHRIPRNSRAIK